MVTHPAASPILPHLHALRPTFPLHRLGGRGPCVLSHHPSHLGSRPLTLLPRGEGGRRDQRRKAKEGGGRFAPLKRGNFRVRHPQYHPSPYYSILLPFLYLQDGGGDGNGNVRAANVYLWTSRPNLPPHSSPLLSTPSRAYCNWLHWQSCAAPVAPMPPWPISRCLLLQGALDGRVPLIMRPLSLCELLPRTQRRGHLPLIWGSHGARVDPASPETGEGSVP